MTPDPGLEAAVPFRWSCLRSGRCCTVGRGRVRVEEDEVPALAAACGLSEEAFAARHLRTIPDGEGGVLLSLTERDEGGGSGRCSLLEGSNTCTVYEARPEHCRTFPYWRGVLEDPEAFERARAVCPGIRVEPAPEARRAAFAELEALYAEVDDWVAGGRPVCLARGVCCRFEEAGHELWATALEADYCAEQHPEAPRPEAPGRCAYHVGGRCTAREGRPLGCRTYFCHDGYREALETGHERFLARIREIEARHGYAPAYGRFPDLLEARLEREEPA
jgi:Fe-S-cluster containining protein